MINIPLFSLKSMMLHKQSLLAMTMAGAVGVGSIVLYSKSSGSLTEESVQEKNFGIQELHRFIERNPQHHDNIIDYAINLKEKNEYPYSRKTIDNFSQVLSSESKRRTEEMKDYLINTAQFAIESGYRKELISKLNSEERLALTGDILKHNTKDFIGHTEQSTRNTLDSFKESKLYKNAKKVGDKIQNQIYRKIGP